MEIPINQIICEDALRELKKLPDETFDMFITSPPYDNLRDYKGYSFNFEGIAREMCRTLKFGGVIVWVKNDQVVNGGESGTSFEQALFFKRIGLTLYDTMIYLKNGNQYPEQKRYYQCFEYMFVLSRGEPKTINLICDRKNKWDGSWGKRSRRNKDGTLSLADKIPYAEFGIRYNVWQINCGHGFSTKDEIAYDHPAIFPDKLAADHIRSWSNPGDLVCDPMCGSGTTCLMAKKLGRNFIGIEISGEYCKIAEARIGKQEYLPLEIPAKPEADQQIDLI